MSSFKGQDPQSKCRKMSCMDQMQATFNYSYRSKQGILRILTFDIDHLTLKKLSKKLETYFNEVLIQNWSRNILSPTINMSFPRNPYFPT